METKQKPNYLRTAGRKERSKAGRQRVAERKATEAAPIEVAAIAASEPRRAVPSIGQRLQALCKSVLPGRRDIEDLRRLERACGEAGVSRSVARKIAQIYFQKGFLNGN
ncbi:hypothetical protein ABC383_07870 [Noviherbaspirillum sp. 1P10PC]|uniref:hypothetical protein n=1 Tax=Noviherbaspirillum sp. 1P10PC TaxID=3132292 RepID=UPI0039A3272B